MIYIFQDETKIPKRWLMKVARLQARLEQLCTPVARKEFIDANSNVWGEIKNQLLEMSHGKCWYSEAPDAVSDWHVDHFRPKKRVLDERKVEHDGYYWLAFDWKNYRIAGSYPNSPHRDGKGETRGKWDYFPLATGCSYANWDHRDCRDEICLILDPANENDPKLLTFDEEGLPIASDPKNPITLRKVETTIHYLYLDSPRLVAARKRQWRETLDWIEEYRRSAPTSYEDCDAEDFRRFERLLKKLTRLAGPKAPYAATARACLRASGLGELIPAPENRIAA
jgi:uncharacterized protein (TIGR02646 family)